MSTSRFFITTPIFYVNAGECTKINGDGQKIGRIWDSKAIKALIDGSATAPHIGHLYSALLADAQFRWQKTKNQSLSGLFSVGTDEHGMKIQQAAAAAQKDVKLLCDENSGKFRSLFDKAGIQYSKFTRTTDSTHMASVSHAWNVLQKKGLIYKGSYSGWYCTSDETFLTESQINVKTEPDGKEIRTSSESGHRVEWMAEENYLFKLGSFQNDLKRWIGGNPVIPLNFNQLVEHWLNERELADLSVSRSSERLTWGIPVPGDSSQRIYVWLDALMNYLTVCGYPNGQFSRFWPADFQIVGKDILKFHAIYWPAFLMGLGLEPPRKLLCHSHWLVDHQKMSKSLGNVVDPFDRMTRYTVDGLRYALLREGVPHCDSNYSDEKVIAYLNTELANTLGNLLNRCTSTSVNRAQSIPLTPSLSDLQSTLGPDGTALIASLQALPNTVNVHYEAFNFYHGIEAVMTVLRDTNSLVQNTAPWTLVKSQDSKDREKLDHVLFLALEVLKVTGLLLSPVTPGLSGVLLAKLNFSPPIRLELSGVTAVPGDPAKKLAVGGVRLFDRIVSDGEKKR